MFLTFAARIQVYCIQQHNFDAFNNDAFFVLLSLLSLLSNHFLFQYHRFNNQITHTCFCLILQNLAERDLGRQDFPHINGHHVVNLLTRVYTQSYFKKNKQSQISRITKSNALACAVDVSEQICSIKGTAVRHNS